MRRLTCAAALAALLAACAGVGGEPRGDRAPIDHVVVLFLENRAFDHLFGTYPGADGLANYTGRQVDKSGVTYATLPPPLGRDGKPDPRFPADLPNAPFPMLRFVQSLDLTNNPVHRFYHMQRQYGAGADGVPMGKWVAEGTSGGITMGFYDGAASPAQWRLADEFVLLDRYFQSVHGGSFANHYFLITAGLMPHHNPFQYVRRVMDSPDGRARIRDAAEFPGALRDGTLPSVAFVKPHAPRNAHPAYSTVGAGDRWIGETVRQIMASRYWPRVAVVITYDEGGGWFDHVRPPAVDRFGLGTRVPALVVSPYARRGLVAHGQYEHASILKLIEWRWNLEPLTARDRAAGAFLEAFDFSQPP